LKEKATELFKKGDIQAAIDKFGECIELDELNVHYNAVIYFNMALGLAKQKKNEESLKCLNKAVNLNPKYGKAFVKRGEIN
jgi:tetratricopeptide (TPR) repeat protein